VRGVAGGKGKVLLGFLVGIAFFIIGRAFQVIKKAAFCWAALFVFT
jgi:hypothetical protein